MVKITLSIRKTIEEQAASHFEASKKARRKLEGTKATIERYEKELPAAQENLKAKEARKARNKEWYEKFRWTKTSSGLLVIGGRDAGSNEVLLKKHVEPKDVVVHSEEPASPFVIIKNHAETLDELSLEEAAQFCAAYSRAWKNGAALTEIFWVKPEQVSKTPNTGEYLGKGSFVVRGNKNFIKAPVKIALGHLQGVPAAASESAFEKQEEKGVIYALLVPGDEKSSDTAKKLVKRLGATSDEWVSLIPPGGTKIAGFKRTPK